MGEFVLEQLYVSLQLRETTKEVILQWWRLIRTIDEEALV